MINRRLRKTPLMVQKQVYATPQRLQSSYFGEDATCPFCGQVVKTYYVDDDTRPQGKLAIPYDMCQHFSRFLMLPELKVVANFSGPADLLDEESE